MSALGAVLSFTMVAQTLRMSVPYAAAATGGVLGERSGVVNITLEGALLAGGFAAIACDLATGSPAAGVLAAVCAGAVFSLSHAALVVHGRVDGIVSGIAMNLLAASGTRLLLRTLYGSSSNSPTAPGFHFLAVDARTGSGLLLHTLVDPPTPLVALAVIGVAWLLRATPFGLRIRAAGEAPRALASVGVDVARIRVLATTLGGAITGLGGAALALDQHQFQAQMSGGRGYIALAAVVLSGWNARRAALLCVAFAFLDALQIVLQNETAVPVQLLTSLPYVATLVALGVVLGRGRGSFAAPAGLGRQPDE